jgi:hypothetical protein
MGRLAIFYEFIKIPNDQTITIYIITQALMADVEKLKNMMLSNYIVKPITTAELKKILSSSCLPLLVAKGTNYLLVVLVKNDKQSNVAQKILLLSHAN